MCEMVRRKKVIISIASLQSTSSYPIIYEVTGRPHNRL